MSRDPRLLISDIKASRVKIVSYVGEMSREEFIEDTRTYDAVVRNLEIVGEAAKRVPQEVKNALPEIEWRKISGLRDLLAHAYFGIDDDLLWDVVKNKVPELEALIEPYLS